MALLLRMQPKNLILVGDHKQLRPTSMIPPQVCISKLIDDCGWKEHTFEMCMCNSILLSFALSPSRSPFSACALFPSCACLLFLIMSLIILVCVDDPKLVNISVSRSCKAPAMIDRYSSAALQLLALFTVLKNSIACPKLSAKSSQNFFTTDCCAHLLQSP